MIKYYHVCETPADSLQQMIECLSFSHVCLTRKAKKTQKMITYNCSCTNVYKSKEIHKEIVTDFLFRPIKLKN